MADTRSVYEIVGEFDENEVELIQLAYECLTRVGQATALNGEWHYLIDESHQKLGVILAMREAGKAIGRIK